MYAKAGKAAVGALVGLVLGAVAMWQYAVWRRDQAQHPAPKSPVISARANATGLHVVIRPRGRDGFVVIRIRDGKIWRSGRWTGCPSWSPGGARLWYKVSNAVHKPGWWEYDLSDGSKRPIPWLCAERDW